MKKIIGKTSCIGAAAAISINLVGCDKPPQAPSSAVPGSTAAPGSAAPGGAASPAAGLDCEDKDHFTEACGYGSPTKYAVLDPNGIRNV